jgi:hypothetical protein
MAVGIPIGNENSYRNCMYVCMYVCMYKLYFNTEISSLHK